jgi:diguanylate cyclase (GGDEF)-like protein
LAYPLADIVLLALVVFVFVITDWRPGRAWLLIGAAFALFAIGDGIYLFQSATNSYDEGTLLDLCWPAAMVLLGAAAWQRPGRLATVGLVGRPLIGTPLVCGLVAIGILVSDRVSTLNLIAVGLAAATLMMVLLRTALTLRENAGMLGRANELSLTDPLTGLANRRKLVADLEHALTERHREDRLLAIYDLDGFKRYNDTYGHPAGDALLVRLAHKLDLVAHEYGRAYRLGGDEFCLLATISDAQTASLLDRTVDALSEEGEGFTVSSSFGVAFLPDEADELSAALALADQRLYQHKQQTQNAREAPQEVLLRALAEREPELRKHLDGVARLSLAVGAQLGLSDEQLQELQLAAQLHDVGKLAIPDTILEKPGPLTQHEWAFVKQHTLIGQRILAGAPVLHKVAQIVRSTHEHWDGTGYPDGLAHYDIPLTARIIAVCDAYDASTTDRLYHKALTPQQAQQELQRCAGSQFDPDIVHAFRKALTAIEQPQPLKTTPRPQEHAA